ncbi:hypothetical protein D3C74_281160 [compost metagenome]
MDIDLLIDERGEIVPVSPLSATPFMRYQLNLHPLQLAGLRYRASGDDRGGIRLRGWMKPQRIVRILIAVHLHLSAEQLLGIAFAESMADFVQHEPCGFVGNPDHLTQPQRRDAIGKQE